MYIRAEASKHPGFSTHQIPQVMLGISMGLEKALDQVCSQDHLGAENWEQTPGKSCVIVRDPWTSSVIPLPRCVFSISDWVIGWELASRKPELESYVMTQAEKGTIAGCVCSFCGVVSLWVFNWMPKSSWFSFNKTPFWTLLSSFLQSENTSCLRLCGLL